MSLSMRLEFTWTGRIAGWLTSRLTAAVMLSAHNARFPRNQFRDSPDVTGWTLGARLDSPSIMGSSRARNDR